MTIPCKKQPFRLYGKEGVALVDLLIGESEPNPKVPCSTFNQRFVVIICARSFMVLILIS